MSIEILNQYNLQIQRRLGRGCNISGHWLSTYIYIFRDKDDVREFIDDLQLAIDGQFSSIEDPDKGASLSTYFFAEITPDNFQIWQRGTEKFIIPLEDFRDILIEWHNCLSS